MININVLDKNFNITGVIDTYESFIWTDRFRDFGDFELYTSASADILDLCRQEYYLQIAESPHMMIIEDVEVRTDSEQGNHVRVTGRSLESILDRRIIWDQTTVSGGRDHTLKTAIEILFKLCFGFGYLGTERTVKRTSTSQAYTAIRYTVPLEYYKKGVQQTQTLDVRKERVIRDLIYLRPAEDALIYWDDEEEDYVDITIDKTQYTGDNLYDVLQDIIEGYMAYGIGYRILPLYEMRKIYTEDYLQERTGVPFNPNTNKLGKQVNGVWSDLSEYTWVFELYTGVERTYEQFDVPYVVFSPSYDNIINTDYLDSINRYKNVSLVLGEGEDTNRKRYIVGGKDSNNNYIDALERRELYTDARDLQTADYDTTKDYNLALKQRGLEDLYECSREVTYDGEVEAERMFVYGEDFSMGDVVQIKNEYDIGGTARIIEYIISESDSGRSFYPTFDDVTLVSDATEMEDDGTGS